MGPAGSSSDYTITDLGSLRLEVSDAMAATLSARNHLPGTGLSLRIRADGRRCFLT
jgi:hypothetical protein